MQKIDAKIFADQLNALAEVFARTAVTPKALEVWFDALRDFPAERVMGVLIGWPKSHQRFPVPSEVWKICNEAGAEHREQRAERERAQNSSPRVPHMATERGKQIIAAMRQIFSRPKMNPIEHWHCVLAGDYPERAKDRAREALAILQRGRKRAPVVEREPGQDDEEREAA